MLMRSRIMYSVNTVIIFICLLGFYQVYEKAGLPVVFDHSSLTVEQTTLSQPNTFLKVGDKLIAAEDKLLSSQEDLEFLLDAKSVDENIELTLERQKSIIFINEPLIHCYSIRYIVIQILIAAVFIFLGLFVYIKRKEDLAANIFNLVMLFSALIISTTWGRYTILPFDLGYFIRLIFNSAYTFASVVFVHFTFVFPYHKTKGTKNYFLVGLYLLAGIFTIITGYAFVEAASAVDLGWFRVYNLLFNNSRLFFVCCIVFGIANFIHTYVTAGEESERRKLRWILLGLAIGPLCLILLWIIPQMLTSKGLVDEEFVLIAMLSVPLTVTISIVKYHILDIDQIFKRGTVYSLVLFFVLFIYVAVSSILSIFVGQITTTNTLMVSTISAIIISASFQPIRNWAQSFVDKKFFHVRYNFRIAEKTYIEKLKYCYDKRTLSEIVLSETEKLIQAKRMAIVIINDNGNEIISRNHENIFSNNGINYLCELLRKEYLPIADNKHIEDGAKYLAADKNLFQQLNSVIAFRIYSETNGLLGVLLLDEKKSGFKYVLEDIDLIDTFCHQAALAVDRITLQNKLISEKVKSNRLKELNELKTYFVSSVTHELKTPLTSINMFAELLEEKSKINKAATNEYLGIIKGESARLSRLIDNVLNITKIEKGIKEYHFEEVELNETVNDVLKTMRYQFKINGFECKAKLSKKKLFINADKDAVEEILINLISNAIKYSRDKRRITVSTTLENNKVKLVVKDWGIGIAQEDLKKILQPFERVDSPVVKRKSGAGLGLALVNHIVNAHKAKLEIISKAGKGSSFIVNFSLYKGKKYEEDSNN